MDNGPAKKSDSFAWCRNQKCKKYNLPQTESRFKSIAQVKLEPIVQRTEAEENAAMNAAIELALKGVVVPKEEPSVLTDTRTRVKAALVLMERTHPRTTIALAMAIVAQEMESFAVANALIAEYDLETQFGIKKRSK